MAEDKTTGLIEQDKPQFTFQPLQEAIPQASELDNFWFKGSGISESDLNRFLENQPDGGIALFEGEELRGFATFEVVESGKLPQDYSGVVPLEGKYLFIQQFTTDQNYSGNMLVDAALLAEVEKRARVVGCVFVAEALSINHPFSIERSLKERGVQHDAFGFYKEHGYQRHDKLSWRWQTENYPSEACVLLTKNFT